MSGATEIESESTLPAQRARLCVECGYDLQGLGTGGTCPECGTVIGEPGTSADVHWRRGVTVGLFLLLWVSIRGIEAVLVQPFTQTLAGILPSLNMPGPKLWVEALLQRPIGFGPETPGVAGTRACLMSLLAVWLITIRPPGGEGEKGSVLRLAARWGAVIPFGFFFGVLLASQGFWPHNLSPYRLSILVFAELPAAILLYAYLAALAQTVPGQERRRVFDHLRWAVPATMVLGAVLATVAWLSKGTDSTRSLDRLNLPISASYGILSVVCAMVAFVAVGRLMLAFGAIGFAGSVCVFSGARRAVASAWRFGRGIDIDKSRRLAVAVGLLLFVAVTVIGNDQILWYDTRAGLAGNLPYFNFPGPKLWVAAGVPQLGHRYDWQPILSHTSLTILNLAAVWLMTVRLRIDGKDEIFRKIARYVPFIAMGIAIGCAGGWRGGRSEELGAGFRSEYFAGVMILCEVPATVLLYLYCAQVAGTVAQRPKLATQLVVIGVCIPVLAGLAMVAFSLSSEHRDQRFSLVTLISCGAAGAAAFLGAAWAVVSLVKLAAAIVWVAPPIDSVEPESNSLSPVLGETWGGDGLL